MKEKQGYLEILDIVFIAHHLGNLAHCSDTNDAFQSEVGL